MPRVPRFFVHMDGKSFLQRTSRHTFNLSSVKLFTLFLHFYLFFFLVYKDEVGGWAPPTELSQSSGAAAHTYTWFSLTTYLLIYNVILEILFISRIQYSPVRRERGGGFVKAIIFARRIISLHFGSRILLLITNSPVEHGTQIPLRFFAFLPRANSFFFFFLSKSKDKIEYPFFPAVLNLIVLRPIYLLLLSGLMS